MPKVTGQVVFEIPPSQIDKALQIVKLELISLADAPSSVIARFERHIGDEDISHLPFELSVDTEVEPRGIYTVSAHVSLHPDDDPNDIRRGDYLTMQTYPVLTQGNPDNLEIVVKRVG